MDGIGNIANQYMNNANARNMTEILERRKRNREVLFNVDDTSIEDTIQKQDPLFNKIEFLAFAGDTFVKLQYAWSDC